MRNQVINETMEMNIEEVLVQERNTLVQGLKALEGNMVSIDIFEPKRKTIYIDNMQIIDGDQIVLKDSKGKKSFKLNAPVLAAECFGILGSYVELANDMYMSINLA